MRKHRTVLRGVVIAGVLASGLLITPAPVAADDRPAFCGPLGSSISWLRGLPSSGWRNALLQRLALEGYTDDAKAAINVWNAHCLLPSDSPVLPPSGGGGVGV
jgi:hypothetical protein